MSTYRQGAWRRTEQADARSVAEQRSRHSYHDAMALALSLGFSVREAPFAAAARMTRGKTSVRAMREHLRIEYPHLYEQEAQCPPTTSP